MAEINFSEKELEDFLCNGGRKGNLKKYLNLEFISRQVNCSTGIIDILAYSKIKKSFIIIELKKDNLDYKAFFQAHKYLRAFDYKYNCCEKILLKNKFGKEYLKRKKRFILLLIGRNLSDELYYSVDHYEEDSEFSTNEPESNIFQYALFGFNFRNGISFDWYNKVQEEIDWYDFK